MNPMRVFVLEAGGQPGGPDPLRHHGRGRTELQVPRTEAFRQVGIRPDPVELAVGALRAQRQFFAHARDRSRADQSATDALILDHALVRIDAEPVWHDQLPAAVPKLGDGAVARRTPAGRTPPPTAGPPARRRTPPSAPRPVTQRPAL